MECRSGAALLVLPVLVLYYTALVLVVLVAVPVNGTEID
jgi:hypothetical protein